MNRKKIKPKALNAPSPKKMNRTELAYARMLECRKQAGEIVRYEFEGLSLKLADGAKYTPDFYVLFKDHVELHEIKGGLVREAALVRFKVAVERYPEFGWSWCQFKNKKEGWSIKEF